MIDPRRASDWSTPSRSSSSRASTATRSATSCERLSARRCTASTPGATSKARCWPPCKWKRAILNLLLFLIIAVAGFGILAIFYMIVVEKTRDIGILKSLGASGRGVMGIFLGYGLSLGLVGSGVGMVVGLLFVRYINEIAAGWAGSPASRCSIRRSTTSTRFPRSSCRRRSSGSWRRAVHRRGGQHSAGATRGPAASRGGPAL